MVYCSKRYFSGSTTIERIKMTKKLNLLFMLAFCLCLSFVIFISLSSSYILKYSDNFKVIFYVAGFLAIALFPVSVLSFIFSVSYKFISRDKLYKDIISKSPIYAIIWKELKEYDKS